MSSFWERTNWTFTMKATVSLKKPLVIIVEQATAMPMIDSSVRTGLRSMFLRMIRDGWASQRPIPVFSMSVTRYCAGASGRIASAGGCLEARHSEWTVPTRAEEMLMKIAAMTTPGWRV